jgi:hypothetical protein
MSDGSMIYISERAAPNVVLLERWAIGFGPTLHPRIGGKGIIVDPDTGMTSRAHSENPYAGRTGWVLRAMGPKAEAERGLRGPDAASRLRHWFVRLPDEHRVALYPPMRGPNSPGLPKGDPLRAPGSTFRQWVGDECITTLIKLASAGSPQVKPLLFAVKPSQRAMIPETRQVLTIYPIQDMQRVFQRYAKGCALRPPSGMSLKQAGVQALGFETMLKAKSAGAGIVYEAWRARSLQATPKQRLILNTAYHRLLLRRFLDNRPLTPKAHPRKPRSAVSAETERRANLIQAYRVFVFDRRGCPVGINVPLLEANNIRIKSVLDRKITHADFTRGQAKAKVWGAWLFTDVLNKRISECRPAEQIHGLAELLAVVDRFE